jgi:hypothetical protein
MCVVRYTASCDRSATHTAGVRWRLLLALGLLFLAAAGCGSAVHQIDDWRAEPPYIPPPPPTPPGPRAPATPAQSGSGAPSDAQVARDLERAFGTDAARAVDAASLTGAGLATVPPTAPARVADIISAANQVASKPYVYGGGHGRVAGETFVDTAYDCSGSVSFALAAAGFVDRPMDSTALARFGRPGRGRWVTIYANAGHAFMTVAGLRFDTSGRAAGGSRWQATSRSVSGFTVRHPPGL